MGPEIDRAQRELSKAIADRRVKAWGRPLTNGQAHGLLQQIPGDPFKLSDVSVVVTVYGDMTTLPVYKQYSGPRWREIEVDANDMKREWVRPPPLSAQNWMLQDARKLQTQKRRGKRDDMVKRCMEETGCTQREAQAAHKDLPEEFRMPRGKPIKKPD